MDAGDAALDRKAGAALRHVEGVGDPHDARLERVGLTAAAVADDAVEDLGDDDGQLRLLVDAVEQGAQLRLGEEEAVGLVVGAVDRHARVVEHRPRDHDDLGVAVAHAVVGDHRRLDAGPVGQAKDAQGDVGDDLDVDPGVVGHAEALGGDLLHVPPGEHLAIGGDALDEALEAAVAAGREAEARLGDPLAERAPVRLRSGGFVVGHGISLAAPAEGGRSGRSGSYARSRLGHSAPRAPRTPGPAGTRGRCLLVDRPQHPRVLLREVHRRADPPPRPGASAPDVRGRPAPSRLGRRRYWPQTGQGLEPDCE